MNRTRGIRGVGVVVAIVAIVVAFGLREPVPSAGSARMQHYVVSQGDTLVSIAEAGTTGDPLEYAEQIRVVNGLVTEQVEPGQDLLLPLP